jgi:predicted transcriptional regulator
MGAELLGPIEGVTMSTTVNDLFARTAADLMTPNVLRLRLEMPLREAVGLLLKNQVSGAPVVDSTGRCVGVFSAVDYLRFAGSGTVLASPPAWMTISCPYWVRKVLSHGGEVPVCTLPAGACPLQATPPDGEGKEVACTQPHDVLVDWQIVELEELPTEAVRKFMTADPVTVGQDTPIQTLARMMIDAHIHRLIVVDDETRVVGIVSSTDVLAAVAAGP